MNLTVKYECCAGACVSVTHSCCQSESHICCLDMTPVISTNTGVYNPVYPSVGLRHMYVSGL